MIQEGHRPAVELKSGPTEELSEANRARLNARANRELVWAVLAQVVMAVAAAMLAAAVAGKLAALSALAGAAAYLLPNSWLALRLFVGARRSVPMGPVALLVQALLKLLVAALLLWGLAQAAQEWLVWPAVLLGLVCTLKGYLLLLICRKLSWCQYKS